MMPVFSSETLIALLREAGASSTEICGLLRGRNESEVTIEPAANVAGNPARHFEIDPAALFAAHRDARAGAAAILGCYHSHPSGNADPSATDAAQAAPDGRLWLIAAGGTMRLWRAIAKGERHGRFDPVRFAVRHGANIEKNCEAVHMDATGRTLTFAGMQGSSH